MLNSDDLYGPVSFGGGGGGGGGGGSDSRGRGGHGASNRGSQMRSMDIPDGPTYSPHEPTHGSVVNYGAMTDHLAEVYGNAAVVAGITYSGLGPAAQVGLGIAAGIVSNMDHGR
jgi:hypothetical protein